MSLSKLYTYKILPLSKRKEWPKHKKTALDVCLMLIKFL